MFLLLKFVASVFFTLSVRESSTFFFINGTFKTQKLKNSLEACFSIKSYTQIFMNLCNKLFQINLNKIVMQTMIIQCCKVYEAYIKFNTTQKTKKTKNSFF